MKTRLLWKLKKKAKKSVHLGKLTVVNDMLMQLVNVLEPVLGLWITKSFKKFKISKNRNYQSLVNKEIEL